MRSTGWYLMIALFSSGRCLAALNAMHRTALAADIERVKCPIFVGLTGDMGAQSSRSDPAGARRWY
jgi:hypothetical protein